MVISVVLPFKACVLRHRAAFSAAVIPSLAIAAFTLFVLPARAQTVNDMTATTPFVQTKTTDASGHVTYRVGAVFAARSGLTRRMSLTLICTPKPPAATLSMFIVQQGATVPAQSGATQIEMQVDARPAQKVAAQRTISMPLSAYAVTDAAAVRAAAQTMRKGNKLQLRLDGNLYDLPLAGLDAELNDLTKACPGWE
jgi:hypothetical protein